MHAYCSEIKHLNPRIYKFKCKPDVFSPGLPLTESAEDLFLPGFLSSNFNVQRQTAFFFSFLYIFFRSFAVCHQHATAHICTSVGPQDLNMKHSSDVHEHTAECTYMAWGAHRFTRPSPVRCALVLTDSRSAHLQTSPSHSGRVLIYWRDDGQQHPPTPILPPNPQRLISHANRHRGVERESGPAFDNWKTLSKTLCQTTGVLLSTSSH